VLRALGLGDLLTAVPALRALRRAFADHEVVLACPAVLGPLVRLAGVADTVLDTDGVAGLPTRLDWGGPPPDVAVNLHGRGPQSHRLLLEVGTGELVGFACEEAGHAGPPWREDEHEVRRWCRLLEDGPGIDPDPRDLRLSVPSTDPPAPGAVVVHPGAAYPSRRWPPDRFADVARALAARGHTVVVTGGAGEVELAEDVRRRAGLPVEALLAGRTGLLELAALVAGARLVVCGDTGVAHLATAYATPSVLLFGPTPPERWGPATDGPHVVLRGDADPADSGWVGDPWGDTVDPALAAVGVDDVLCALDRPLVRPRPARRTTRGSA
jgi:ADP-heptose:LPS heptosyltransferase